MLCKVYLLPCMGKGCPSAGVEDGSLGLETAIGNFAQLPELSHLLLAWKSMAAADAGRLSTC